MILYKITGSSNAYYVTCLDKNDRRISAYMGEFESYFAESDSFVVKEEWGTDPVLYFNGGQTLQVKVWSKIKNLDESSIGFCDSDGNAVDSIDWVSYTLVSKTKIPGNEHYIYTYDIKCPEYTGTEARYCYMWFDVVLIPIVQGGMTYNLTVSPSNINFKQVGGRSAVTISCPEGDAYISDPTVDWLYWQQTGATKIEGSDYYTYTYDIIVKNSNLTGADRTTTLTVGVEGVSTETVSKKITITQKDYDYTVVVLTGSLTFDKNGGSQTVTVRTNQLRYPIVCSGTSWMTITQLSTTVSGGCRTTQFTITTDAYAGTKQEGTLVFNLKDISVSEHPESFKSLYAVQYGAEYTE